MIESAFEGRSVPISRRLILYHYLDAVYKNLKSDQPLTKEALNQALEKGLQGYMKDYSDRIYKNPVE